MLNADDAGVLEMASHTKGKLLLFSHTADSPAVLEHLKNDGRAVLREGEQIVLCHGALRMPVLGLAPLRCPVLGLPAFLVDDLLAAVAAAIALGATSEQIQAGLAACLGQGGVAIFDLPKTTARPNGGLLVLTPARNASALEAWGRHLQEQFPGRRAQLLIEPAADWRAADAEALLTQLTQCFSEITIALNSDAPSFVEALEMTRPGLHSRPIGQSSDLTACLDQLLEGQPRRGSGMRLPRKCCGFSECTASSRNKRSAPRKYRWPRLRKTLPMNIESIRALSGPNLWSDQPVLEAVVVLEPTGLGPESLARLCGSLPASLGAALRRDFVAADAPASWAGLIGRLVVGLQAAAGCQVSFWMARALKQGVEYRVAAEYAEEPTARRALELSLALVHAARAGTPVRARARVTRPPQVARRHSPGSEHRLHRARRSGTQDPGTSFDR